MATERIALTQPIESRTGSFAKDSYSANCYFETRDQKREFIKRPGLISHAQVVPVTPPDMLESQGLAGFGNNLIAVIDDEVYSIAPSNWAVTHIGSTSTSTSHSYFVRTFLDQNLFFHNKTNGYLLNSSNAFISLANDIIHKITIDNPGNNYSAGALLAFSAGNATATVTVTGGKITDTTITNAGSGYTTAPTATVQQAAVAYPTATGTSGSSTITVSSGTGITTGQRVFGTGIGTNAKVSGVVGTTISLDVANSGTVSGTVYFRDAITTGTGSSGAFTLSVSSASNIYVGMFVTGTNVGTNAKVTTIVGTTITVDVANSGTVSGTLTFKDNGTGAVLTASLNSFPTGPFVSGVVYLNNYVFLGTSGNRIYNSAVGEPSTWGALDYVTFEQTADTLVGIAKHLNYLVAFGAASTQFFYDAGTAVGSPLGVAQSYTAEIGCAAGDSIVATSNTVLWIGTSKTYGRSVYIMNGVSPERISTPNVDRHLEADDLGEVTAYCYTVNGHTLYILTLHNSNKTLVFDINEKIWYTWTQYAKASADQPNPGTRYESYFRPSFYAQVNGVPYLLDDDTAEIYSLDTATYQDDGEPIYCRTVTDISDNGTTKRKFFGRLEIIGDKTPGTMQVRHTGNDYNTWSNFRAIDLNAPRSQIYMGGADRRRAWEFLVTSNCPLRLDAAEIDFRIGEMDQEQAVGGGRYRR
jgi:hypothetical protein